MTCQRRYTVMLRFGHTKDTKISTLFSFSVRYFLPILFKARRYFTSTNIIKTYCLSRNCIDVVRSRWHYNMVMSRHILSNLDGGGIESISPEKNGRRNFAGEFC